MKRIKVKKDGPSSNSAPISLMDPSADMPPNTYRKTTSLVTCISLETNMKQQFGSAVKCLIEEDCSSKMR